MTKPEYIDHYRIKGILAEGDNRVVYSAIDEKENRASAIRVTDHGKLPSSSAYVAWREGQFDHPLILKHHGTGVHDGREYEAIELADGGMFWLLLDMARRSIPDNVHIEERIKGEYVSSMIVRFHDLALALSSIHTGGYGHGNIKPSNIGVCMPGNQFKLTDIGTRVPSAPSEHLEIADVAFRAPETFSDKTLAPGDARADIYSLGAVLYAALTLELPYDTKDAKEYITRALSSRPIPAASRNPSVPTNVESVVMKAIAPDPADRYQTATDLADELQRLMTDQPVEAPPVPAGDRIQASLKRHWLATLIVLALIGVVGLIVFRDFFF